MSRFIEAVQAFILNVFLSFRRSRAHLFNEEGVEYVVLGGHFDGNDFTRIPNYLSFSRQDGWIDCLTLSLKRDEPD